MDVTPLVREGAQIIQSYSDGGFRVSGHRYDGAALVSSDKTVLWDLSSDAISDVKALREADFSVLIDAAADIDVVLLGTGARMVFLDPALKRYLREAGLNVEIMDSGAACRTFNVLMAEGRRVVAALLVV